MAANMEAPKMRRRSRMCASCIFRGIDKADHDALAALPPDHVPCHTDSEPHGWCDIQCRGHFEARRKITHPTQRSLR